MTPDNYGGDLGGAISCFPPSLKKYGSALDSLSDDPISLSLDFASVWKNKALLLMVHRTGRSVPYPVYTEHGGATLLT